MQRQIMFRGKRTDNGQLVYGYYVYNPLLNTAKMYPFDQERGYVYDVNPDTVWQLLFTTLSDLRLIDGDIFDIGQTVNGQSEFVIMQGVYGIEVYYNYDRTRAYEYSIPELLKDDMSDIKVIGTIHDTPLVNG